MRLARKSPIIGHIAKKIPTARISFACIHSNPCLHKYQSLSNIHESSSAKKAPAMVLCTCRIQREHRLKPLGKVSSCIKGNKRKERSSPWYRNFSYLQTIQNEHAIYNTIKLSWNCILFFISIAI